MKKDLLLTLYRSEFRSFLELAFREVHPEKSFISGWHIDIIADELMRCGPAAAHRLMLNLPPRYLKSFCASVAWPIFMAARNPGLQICVIAGTRELAAEFSELRKCLLASPRLQAVFPQLRFREAGETLTFSNKSQIVQSLVAKSQIGRSADIFIIDDPLSARHARNPKLRDVVNSWYRDEIIARLSRQTKVSLIIVMQRLHDDDLCGFILKSEHNWRVAALSAIAASEERWVLQNGRVIERSKGSVLCEKIEKKADLHSLLHHMKGVNFRAQYLQQPSPPAHDEGTRTVYCEARVSEDWKPGQPKLTSWGGLEVVPEERFVEYEYFGIENPYTQGRARTQAELEVEFKIQQTKSLARHRRERSVSREPDPFTS